MEAQPTTSATSIEKNVKLVKSTYDYFFKGDIDGLLSCYTNDVDWEIYGPAELPAGGPRSGKAEVMRFFEEIDELLEFHKFELHQYIAQGNDVVSLGEYSGTSKVTGKQFNAHFAHVVTIRSGKISKFREYTDTAAALEAMT